MQVAAGLTETEVTFTGLNFDVFDALTIMVHFNNGLATSAGNQARLFYDSVEFDSRVEFTCLARVGRTDCNW